MCFNDLENKKLTSWGESPAWELCFCQEAQDNNFSSSFSLRTFSSCALLIFLCLLCLKAACAIVPSPPPILNSNLLELSGCSAPSFALKLYQWMFAANHTSGFEKDFNFPSLYVFSNRSLLHHHPPPTSDFHNKDRLISTCRDGLECIAWLCQGHKQMGTGLQNSNTTGVFACLIWNDFANYLQKSVFPSVCMRAISRPT